jgi:hypothetical protein
MCGLQANNDRNDDPFCVTNETVSQVFSLWLLTSQTLFACGQAVCS